MANILEIDNFLFDEDKFIHSIAAGDIYKTDYISIEIINNKGFKTLNQKLSYRYSSYFIKDNLVELREKGIVKVKIKK